MFDDEDAALCEGLVLSTRLLPVVPLYRLSFDGMEDQFATQRHSSRFGSPRQHRSVATLPDDAAKSRWYGHGRMRRRFSWDSSDASSATLGYWSASMRQQQYNAVHVNAAIDVSAVISSGPGNLKAMIRGLQVDLEFLMSHSLDVHSSMERGGLSLNTETALAKQAAANALARIQSRVAGGVLKKHSQWEKVLHTSFLEEDEGWYAGGGGPVSPRTVRKKNKVQFTASGVLLMWGSS